MEEAGVVGLVRAVFAVDLVGRDRRELTSAVAVAGRIRAWLDGLDVALAVALAEVDACPELTMAEAGRTSLRDASRVLERCQTVEALPEVGVAVAAGSVSGAHVDVLTGAWRRLEPEQRPQLVERAGWLADLAARTTPDELRRAVSAEVRRIGARDGLSRLERQRRAVRVRTWVDDDGMWCLKGEFDPATGVVLHQHLDAVLARMFAEQLPADAPSDPVERQGFLRAHTLVAAITGHGPSQRAAGSEITVVIDATAVDEMGEPAVDWGLPVELPVEVLREHFEHADVRPVVVRGGVVVHAPGRLDLGRATRLANRAQRRVLRGLYPTCAIPGCPARFDRCKLHHVVWWEHDGATDLANLLPLCVRHHHAVHDHGWQLALTPDRQLTIDHPDGTHQTTGPPKRGGCPHGPPPPPHDTEPVEPAEATAPPRPDDVLQPLLL